MRLVLAGHRCGEHSPNSGYDQLAAVFPSSGWLDGRDLVAGRITWQRPCTDACDAVLSEPDVVFHVFYGDCSGRQLPPLLRARFPLATIVATVHQPGDRLAVDPDVRDALAPVDGIVALSSTQVSALRGLHVSAPMRVVAHGVWTQVFRPLHSRVRRDTVLFVGTYLRDWPGMRAVIDRLTALGVRCVVVGTASAHLDGANPLVDTIGRVDEPELIRRYDAAAAMVLPVVDATACNAMLEAMAVGCPVVHPALAALGEYYPPDTADCYERGDHAAAAGRAAAYVRHPAVRDHRSSALIQHAQRFDWARLRPELLAAYESFAAARRSPATVRTGPGV